MTGFNEQSAKRISSAVKRVERAPYGVKTNRKGDNRTTDCIFFKLNEALVKSNNSMREGVAVEVTVYSPDPDNPPVYTGTSYTPQELIISDPPRIEFVVNRSLDFSASAQTSGLARWINGEWLLVWVDCTQEYQ